MTNTIQINQMVKNIAKTANRQLIANDNLLDKIESFTRSAEEIDTLTDMIDALAGGYTAYSDKEFKAEANGYIKAITRIKELADKLVIPKLI